MNRLARVGTLLFACCAQAFAQSPGNDAMIQDAHAAQSQDPRLAPMTAADRQFVLDQGGYAINYCTSNVVLNGLYSCPCFSNKVVDFRIEHAGETVRAAGRRIPEPFSNMVTKLNLAQCLDPPKIAKYGEQKTRDVLKMDTQVSAGQREQIASCTGATLSSSIQAKSPFVGEMAEGMFQTALQHCRGQTMGGAPPASGSATPTAGLPSAGGSAATASSGSADPRAAVQGMMASARNSVSNFWQKAERSASPSAPAPTAASTSSAVSAPSAPFPVAGQAPQAPADSGAAARNDANRVINANSALYSALIRNDAAACESAIAQGAQVNSMQRGDTMLIVAAKQGLAGTKCLVEHGADISQTEIYSGHTLTPAWAAAEFKRYDAFRYLIEHKADANAVVGTLSLLMYLIAFGASVEDIKVLVEHGADVNYVSSVHKTPLDTAKDARRGDVIEYLISRGAH